MRRLTLAGTPARAACLMLLASLVAAGCGPRDRYAISGSVTLEGKPIPAGTITFVPFGAGKPGRTAGFCEIKAGKYATKTGRNPGSGPHRVMIGGCDGVPYQSQMGEITENHPMGKPLFPTHIVEIDVPEKNGSVFDFDVPGKPQP
jgi:hypothetical protein